MNYQSLLKVDPVTAPGTRVTKVIKKPYGYCIHMFNSYITLYYIKLIVNANGTAKAHYKIDRNYTPIQRYTLYFDTAGNETTRREYQTLNKTSTCKK